MVGMTKIHIGVRCLPNGNPNLQRAVEQALRDKIIERYNSEPEMIETAGPLEQRYLHVDREDESIIFFSPRPIADVPADWAWYGVESATGRYRYTAAVVVDDPEASNEAFAARVVAQTMEILAASLAS
jgi:hypothetical protein